MFEQGSASVHDLAIKGYIPLDKSWTIRMGVLDLLSGREYYINGILAEHRELSDDLLALERCVHDWNSNRTLDVGESGTLYRFLQFTSWKLNLNKQFIRRGTLRNRPINQNPAIVTYPLAELLTLDNGTSQWASAAVLAGSEEMVPRPPYKLALTYEAVAHWKMRQKQGGRWFLRHDATILRQAVAFLGLRSGKKEPFVPVQAEDYCFARAFEYITSEEGAERWPNLRGHETDRIEEMERSLAEFKAGQQIVSQDHRVVQAIVMLGKVKKKRVRVSYPASVNKSWPQFSRFVR
jgi:hypothetical protein